jgi:hypothetical protein
MVDPHRHLPTADNGEPLPWPVPGTYRHDYPDSQASKERLYGVHGQRMNQSSKPVNRDPMLTILSN